MAETFQARAEETGPDAPEQNSQTTEGGTTEGAVDRPDYIPEKFWKGSIEESTKAMSQSYTELEKKLSAPKPKDGETTTTEDNADSDPNTPPADDATEDAKKTLADAGLDFDTYAAKFAENGKLEDADYAELESKGIPRTYVDAFIAGQTALADATSKQLFDAAGGEERAKEMVAWAKQNLTAEQQAAYNKTMDSGDLNSALLAIRGLRAQFEAAEGTGPAATRVAGDTGQTTKSGARPYASQAEMKADMGSPQYKSDPAFRQQVMDRLAVSPNVL